MALDDSASNVTDYLSPTSGNVTDYLSPQSMRSLQTNASASLVRGVSLSNALSGFGKRWSDNVGSQADFDLSVQCDEIGDYISHAWRTPRIEKILSLFYLYNSGPAMVASIAFGVAYAGGLIAITTDDAEPLIGKCTYLDMIIRNGCLFFCLVVYFYVLCRWHAIQGMLRPNLVFLDKICINQCDNKQKRKAILSLAAFLKHSTRIVVLWSEGYFQRLWCTYELAAWIHLGKQAANIVLLPVQLPYIHLCCSFHFMFYPVMMSLLEFHAVDVSWLGGFGYICFYGCLGGITMTFVQSGILVQILQLDEQLATFRIDDSQCFCCTHDHVHPATLAPMPCDRELVYETLSRWHELAGPADDEETEVRNHSLEAFDKNVRTLLRDHVLTLISPRAWSPTYVQTLHSSIPLIWGGLNTFGKACIAGNYVDGVMALFYGTCDTFISVPCFILYACWLMHRGSKLVKMTQRSIFKRLAASMCVWTPMMAAPYYSIWIPSLLPVPPPIALAWYGMLATFLVVYYKCSSKCIRAPAWHSSAAETSSYCQGCAPNMQAREARESHALDVQV
eukprot:TRINITY_DN4473_c0_g1_i1.p1 TRINITY_DN4473_c0_g1~~TRINITY_DN4473_c0_g1_i1.p1  ORF type:complete len:562 (-),score=66.31 TRINITY_DN4473_c0_g1_i1:54-1739(-)